MTLLSKTSNTGIVKWDEMHEHVKKTAENQVAAAKANMKYSLNCCMGSCIFAYRLVLLCKGNMQTGHPFIYGSRCITLDWRFNIWWPIVNVSFRRPNMVVGVSQLIRARAWKSIIAQSRRNETSVLLNFTSKGKVSRCPRIAPANQQMSAKAGRAIDKDMDDCNGSRESRIDCLGKVRYKREAKHILWNCRVEEN